MKWWWERCAIHDVVGIMNQLRATTHFLFPVAVEYPMHRLPAGRIQLDAPPLGAKATSSGIRKLAQYIDLLGATSLTWWIMT